ncbi:acyltransferase family protein [Cellvibrio zantedeschiae]|uniref:acyltransferase family protein n=1 Tax=Cellvibrio zantedeschiae TaxID=1237077 RepID=UPI001675105B|nr:acyltransferase [Cellvibrio zantedeschiae]
MNTIDSYSQQSNNNFTIIRLIAALLVIYGHSYPILGSGHPDLILQLLKSRFAGAVAVDVFFVISGFLICASWERNSFSQFVIARALRIYPALIVCVLLSVFVLGFLLTTESSYFSRPEVWEYLKYNVSLLTNKYYLPGVFETHPDKAVNGSIWSLPYEIRLYACLALLGVLSLLKPGRYLLACVAIGLAYSFDLLSYVHFPMDKSWKNLAPFFMAGAFCWIYRKSIVLSAPILALMIIGCIAFCKTDKFIYFYFITLVYATFYLVYIPQLKWSPKKDVSYGVYLYGWPVQQLVLHFVPGCTPELNAVLSVIFALILGYLSWEFVESPALALRKKIKL